MSFNPFAITAKTSAGSIQSAIAQASQKTGIDFNYLMGQAQIESGMRADARANTSSATGLYQFIDQSWLRVMKQHGAEHGLGWAADSIQTGANGKMTVGDPVIRRAILDLRKDPTTASIMAAEHASDNKDAIESSLGRNATGTDLYMAHFLGLGGARSFLGQMENNPNRSGASLFPAAARANRNIFYGANGQPRSLEQIYDRFAAKLDKGAGVATGSSSFPALDAPQPLTMAAVMDVDGATVIPGMGETSDKAGAWAKATLDQINGANTRQTQSASVMRPTPKTARLAYMMLASLGA